MASTARVKIGEEGRLVIPAEIRNELGIKPGDSVDLRIQDHELRLSTVRARIRRVQEQARQYVAAGTLVSEELSAERREAADTSKTVLDASAILAIIFNEPGSAALSDEIMESAVASTVNLAEVQSKLIKKGYEPDVAWDHALQLVAAEPFTSEQAKTAGTLIGQTSSVGLSLGDRSCLALAITLQAEVYTTEQLWKGLQIGVPIHVIR